MDGEKAELARPPLTLERAAENIVDIACLVQALIRGWYLVVLAVVIGVVQGTWGLHNYVPSYEARMILTPSSSSSSGSGGGAANAAQGLARTLGVSLPGSTEVTNIDRFQALLGSLRLAERLQQRYGLMQVMFAGRWDEKRQRWLRPGGTRFEWEQSIRGFLNLGTWHEPDLETLARAVKGMVAFGTAGEGRSAADKQGLVELSVRYGDPETALFLLTTIFHETDALLREQERQHIIEQRDYIEERLASSARQDSRQVLFGMLSEAEHKAMLLQSDLPYVARILEPPYASREPLPPNVLRYFTPLLGWFAVAALLSVLIYCVRRA